MIRIIYFLLLLNLLIFNAYAEKINSVEIIGNEKITKDTIILFSGIKLNQDINKENLNNIIKELYSTDFFENVSASIKNNKLIITVIENPIIQSIQFNGIKKKSMIEALKSNLILREKNSFVKNRIKKDEENITNILKSNGYYFANVKTNFQKNNNNTINLIYDIELGKKAYIKKIKFIGDKKIKDRKLRSVIVSEEVKFWKFISKRKFLDIKRINLDEKLLKNYYKNKGYYNVRIESSSAKIINESDFELIFNINAGKKYKFGNLLLEIPDEFNKDNFINLYKIIEKLEGKFYSLNKLEDILDEIDKIILQQEFQFSEVKYDQKINNQNINIKIFIEEGKKQYVERIDIFGNYITEENVIRNSLLIDEGDAYNEILWNKSINEIKSRNIFGKVKFKVKEGSNQNKKQIEITVEEKPTGEIFAGAGTGTSGSTLSLGLKENNYLGKGLKVNSNLSISDDSISGIISVNNPNYKNTDRSLRTSFQSVEKDRMTVYGYKNTKTGFSIGTTYEQFEDVFFAPSIKTFYESVKTSSTASSSMKKQEGSYFETEFTYGLTLNRLDQNFQPTEGFRSSFTQTLPLYTNDNAIENSYRFSKYFSMKDEMIFSFKIYTKAVNSLTGDDVRITKRVNIPSRMLRGFEFGKIGPQDNGDYVGGNYGASLNFAATLPRFLPEFEEIDFSLFLDLANVWGIDYSDTIDGSNKIRSSTGLAIDWFTPIGPLSISIAQPLTKASSDKVEKFRFNIGTTF